MPYKLSDPPDTIKTLPKAAQKIWIETFNAVAEETEDEDAARKAAWSRVKDDWRKVDDKWVSRAALVDIDLIITKASVYQGKMRWAATANDTLPDSRGESTSIPLFGDWIERAEKGIETSFLPPPRNPFLGLSHYPDLDGYGEAGFTEKMYIDGNRFKASGEFYLDDDHPLGKALFEAVRQEQALLKKGETVEEPIRISAAWWDLMHSHGQFIFERKSLNDLCPMCIKGKGDKIYLKGQLDHFAATRVPINQRTSLSLEEKAMAKTRQDDAASIVGGEHAEELEKRTKKMVGKSETEETPGLVIKAGSDFGGYVLTRLGKLKIDVASIDDSIPIQGIISGEVIPEGETLTALADLLKLRASTIKAKLSDEQTAKEEAEAADDQETHADEPTAETTEKAEVEQMDELIMDLPLGGATSMADAEAFIQNTERMDEVYSRFSIFQTVFYNILESPMTMDDQLTALKDTVKEFDRGIQAIKAAVEDVYLSEAVPTKEVNVTEQTTNQDTPTPLAQAHDAVEQALIVEAEAEEKVQAVQKALTVYAEAAQQQLTGEPAPEQPQEQLGAIIARGVAEGLAPFMEVISQMNARQAAQSEQATQPVLAATLPQQKSLVAQPQVNDPQAQQANQLPISPITGQPSQLRAIINRSVGLPTN